MLIQENARPDTLVLVEAPGVSIHVAEGPTPRWRKAFPDRRSPPEEFAVSQPDAVRQKADGLFGFLLLLDDVASFDFTGERVHLGSLPAPPSQFRP